MYDKSKILKRGLVRKSVYIVLQAIDGKWLESQGSKSRQK
jgi:hypothetical protein